MLMPAVMTRVAVAVIMTKFFIKALFCKFEVWHV
jgi:hypothetical protein